MATLSFSCPECGKLHERVNSGMVGYKVKCKCGFVFRLGSKADKNEDFGEVIRKKKEKKRRTAEKAEVAASARPEIANPTFDLLPKFDPLDPNREDVFSPSNEIQSPLVSDAESPVGDSGSMELEDFPLPPPIPEEMKHSVGLAAGGRSVGVEHQGLGSAPDNVAVAAIPDDLLADIEANQEEVQPELPPANGVIREPSQVVKGRHQPIRKKRKNGNSADGTGSVLWSCIGLGLSIVCGLVYFTKFIFGLMSMFGVAYFRAEVGEAEFDAASGFFAWSVVLDTCGSAVLGMSLMFTGVAAGFELGRSKLYQWPWIIQGGLAGLALVWGCLLCGLVWQSGSLAGVVATFFLVCLAPLVLMLNSLARLIIR